jgi:hypothetical protein
MAEDKCKKCSDREEAWDMLFNVKQLVESIDVMIYQATEAGMDQGRVLGLLEAATALDNSGFVELGDAIRKIVNEDVMLLSHPGGEA